MTWPIVDLTFWNPGDGRTPAIDALLADPYTPLAKHGLTGIAAAYARETGAFLHETHRHWAEELGVRTLAADGALTEVVPLLTDAGIPFFVAKGPVIAYRDYPDPSMRPYCDLDIYVVGGRVTEARALLARHGYAPVHHAVGVLGGLAQEVHGGRFSAVVEVHAHPIDNLHRRHLPPIEAFLEHVEHTELCGVKTPVLSPSADLALQVIHLAAGHRYAKLVLLRDIETAQRFAHLDVVASLGVSASIGTALDVLRALGRDVDVDLPGGVARERLVKALTSSNPVSWDEYRLSAANVLALLNQPSWAAAGRAIIAAAPALGPRRRRRVSLRLSSSTGAPEFTSGETAHQGEPSRVIRVPLVGTHVDLIDMPCLTEAAAQFVADRHRAIIANHNLHSLALVKTDARLLRFYDQADLIHIDGIGAVGVAKLLGYPANRLHRVTYADWIWHLLTRAQTEGWRVYYLGSRPEVMVQGLAKLRRTFPELVILGRDGMFDASPSSKESDAVILGIRLFRPDILFVGMGMPRQEYWIMDYLERLPPTVALPAGGCLDVVSGAVKPTPRWLGGFGWTWFFWLYRLMQEPRRLWRRYLIEPWTLVPKIASQALISRGQETKTRTLAEIVGRM